MKSMLFVLLWLWSLKGLLLVAWWVENFLYLKSLRMMRAICQNQHIYRMTEAQMHWRDYAPLSPLPVIPPAGRSV